MLLVDFLDNRLPEFNDDRAKVDRDSTSRLSPYIHFGEISVRLLQASSVSELEMVCSYTKCSTTLG